jgi:hypothetical protein
MTSKHDPELIAGYLAHYQYRSIEEWAADSDYLYSKDEDCWYNEEGHLVDIYSQFDKALDQLIEDCE